MSTSDEDKTDDRIPVLWFDARGCGPDELMLQLQSFPADLGGEIPAFLGLRVRSAGIVIGAGALVDGGFNLHRDQVAELHRQLGTWLEALEEIARTPTTEIADHPPVVGSPTRLTSDRRPGEASEASDVKVSIAALQRMCRDEDENHDAELALAAPALVEVAAAALAWASSVCETQSVETHDHTVAATTGKCAGDTHVWECPVNRSGRTLATALVALSKFHPIATDGARDRSRPR